MKKNTALLRQIMAYTILLLGLLISFLLLSEKLIIYPNARFETGKQITDFLIFILSALLYYVLSRNLSLIVLLIGFLVSCFSYLISDLIIVNYFLFDKLIATDAILYVIHIASIAILLFFEFILRKLTSKKIS